MSGSTTHNFSNHKIGDDLFVGIGPLVFNTSPLSTLISPLSLRTEIELIEEESSTPGFKDSSVNESDIKCWGDDSSGVRVTDTVSWMLSAHDNNDSEASGVKPAKNKSKGRTLNNNNNHSDNKDGKATPLKKERVTPCSFIGPLSEHIHIESDNIYDLLTYRSSYSKALHQLCENRDFNVFPISDDFFSQAHTSLLENEAICKNIADYEANVEEQRRRKMIKRESTTEQQKSVGKKKALRAARRASQLAMLMSTGEGGGDDTSTSNEGNGGNGGAPSLEVSLSVEEVENKKQALRTARLANLAALEAGESSDGDDGSDGDGDDGSDGDGDGSIGASVGEGGEGGGGGTTSSAMASSLWEQGKGDGMHLKGDDMHLERDDMHLERETDVYGADEQARQKDVKLANMSVRYSYNGGSQDYSATKLTDTSYLHHLQETLKYDTFSSALGTDPGVTAKVGKAGYVFVAGSSLGIGAKSGPSGGTGNDGDNAGGSSSDGAANSTSSGSQEFGACDTLYGTSAGGSAALVPLLERCGMNNKAVFLSLVGGTLRMNMRTDLSVILQYVDFLFITEIECRRAVIQLFYRHDATLEESAKLLAGYVKMSQQRPRTVVVLPNPRLSYSDDAYLRQRRALEVRAAKARRAALAAGREPEKPRSGLTSDGRPIFPAFADYDDNAHDNVDALGGKAMICNLGEAVYVPGWPMEGVDGGMMGAAGDMLGASTVSAGSSYEGRQYYYNATQRAMRSSGDGGNGGGRGGVGSAAFDSSLFSPTSISNNYGNGNDDDDDDGDGDGDGNDGDGDGDGDGDESTSLDLPHNPLSRRPLSSLSPEQHLTLADKFIGGFIAMVIRCELHINAQHSDLVSATSATSFVRKTLPSVKVVEDAQARSKRKQRQRAEEGVTDTAYRLQLRAEALTKDKEKRAGSKGGDKGRDTSGVHREPSNEGKRDKKDGWRAGRGGRGPSPPSTALNPQNRRRGLTYNNLKTLFLSGDSRGAPAPYRHTPWKPGQTEKALRRSAHPGERAGQGSASTFLSTSIGNGDNESTSTAGLGLTQGTDPGGMALRKDTPAREIPVLSWGYDENEYNDSGKEPWLRTLAPLSALSLSQAAPGGSKDPGTLQSSRSDLSMTSTGTVKFTASHLKWAEPLPCGSLNIITGKRLLFECVQAGYYALYTCAEGEGEGEGGDTTAGVQREPCRFFDLPPTAM